MAPLTLYHYTSLESLTKIFGLDEDHISLRFTEINHLNDPSEQKYYFQQLNFSEDEFRRIIENETFYVFSLSEICNNLEMWRLYAKDAEGVSIGFNKELLLGPTPNDDVYSSPIHLIPCCYGREMIDLVSNDATKLGDNVNFDLSCMFKNECYKYEHEFRLVFSSQNNGEEHKYQKFQRNVVNEVWLGPKNSQNEDYVRSIIGDGIRIQKSSLPYI